MQISQEVSDELVSEIYAKMDRFKYELINDFTEQRANNELYCAISDWRHRHRIPNRFQVGSKVKFGEYYSGELAVWLKKPSYIMEIEFAPELLELINTLEYDRSVMIPIKHYELIKEIIE